MALTDRFIINLKTTGKAHKHFDGGGLHIHVSPVGGKLWRMAYRCRKARIAIEIDGRQHLNDPNAYRRDRKKRFTFAGKRLAGHATACR